jgi:DNA-directed RNA polymerase subunit K/omega
MAQKFTKYERARLISARALQLSVGAPPLIKPKESDTPYDVALKEFYADKLPLQIIRTLPAEEE